MMIESMEILMDEACGISAVCQDCFDKDGERGLILFETPTQKTEDFMQADLASLLHGDFFPDHRIVIFRQVYPN